MALGTCVECGREVSVDATSCPGCGKPRPTKKKMGLGAKIGLGIFGLLLLGMIIPNVSRNPPPGPSVPAAGAARLPPLPMDQPTVQVEAVELWRAYQANEVSADSRFKDRKLFVTGDIHSITKDAFDSVIVSLQSPNQFMPSRAYLASGSVGAAEYLRRGQGVKMTCTGGGMIMGSPVLRDCTVTATRQ